MIAVIPIRGFDSAKTRLAAGMSAGERARVAAAVAARVVVACNDGGWIVRVVSSAADVLAWAEMQGVATIADPGLGLDAAAHAGVRAAAGAPWAVIHADLPLISAADLSLVSAAARAGEVALAPSRDGGTNLVAARGPFPFAYGPGSFARHLGRVTTGSPQVVVRTGLAVELDTPTDLAAVLAHPEGRWLARFLS